MRKMLWLGTLVVIVSLSGIGCFVSRKETVRTVPSSTTVEHSTTVVPDPDADVVQRRTTVERY